MPDKTVFVTVGTTKFDNLITTILSPVVLKVIYTFCYLFLFARIFILYYRISVRMSNVLCSLLSRFQALSVRNYKHLILQIGNSSLEPDCTARFGFNKIESFKLSPSIGEYMRSADLVISHAGAGSVLEALEKRKHLIVVINDLLMDNHQVELAEQLYKDEHLYYCTCQNLLNTIETMDLMKLKPFVNDKSANIAGFIDKVMGFR